MNKTATYVLIGILVILLAGLAYFVFQNQKLTKQLLKDKKDSLSQSTPSPSATPTDSKNDQTEDTPVRTKNQTEEAVKTSTNLKNHDGLIPFMTNPVNVLLYASECCEPMTPQDAAKQMDYINEGIPFEFNQNDPTIVNLKTNNPQLQNTYIALSKNKEHLIAFTLNNKNQITDIQISVSWKLYIQ